MIDYGFEDRLIERITLRETIAAVCLTAKQKRVLHYRIRGQTFAEIARDEGLSNTRVDQIFKQSIRKLRHRLRASETGFDKAAFLRHMQDLVAQEATHEQQIFETERAELERMLTKEREPVPHHKPQPQPPPPPPPPPPNNWLLDRLWEAGEYLQVYRYLAARVGHVWRYKHTQYGTFEPDHPGS